MNEYIVTIDGEKYRVKSETPLTDMQAYEFARGQAQSSVVQPLQQNLPKVPYNLNEQRLRAAGQGLSFGFGDELEAAVRAKTTSGPEYERIRDELRAKNRSYSEDRPGEALAAELAGGLVVPGGMLLKGATKAPSMLRTIGTGAATGAASGYGASETPAGAQEQTMLGTALGAGSAAALGGLGRVLSPVVEPYTRELAAQGVKLTPGAIFGGPIRSFEEVGAGTPVIRNLVNPAREESLKSFDMVALNKALQPIGAKPIPKDANVRQGLAYVQDTIGDEYTKIYPKMKLAYNNTLENQLVGLTNRYMGKLPAEQQQFFNAQIERIVSDLQSGPISGARIKALRQDVRDMAVQFRKATGAEGLLADPLRDLDNSLSLSLQNQNRGLAKELRKADEAYAKFVGVQSAVPTGGGTEGLFTPAQFAQSLTRADQSKRKGASRRAESDMMQLAQQGIDVLGNKTPDSGTAGRGAALTLLMGGASQIDPTAAIGTTLLGGLYTDPGMALMQRYIGAQRPAAVQAVGNALNQAAPYAAQPIMSIWPE